ncbi:MAG: hypothetical protein HN760_02285 [Microbacteriaceae bacterium]|nr:hypothetical protein [Microbacteriaceae bacterium]
MTISRTTENPGLFGKVKRLFGSGGEKRSSDLTLAFERESAGDGQTVAEYFTVDTSLLLPGEYRIGIQAIASGNGGNDYTWNTFQLVEEE